MKTIIRKIFSKKDQEFTEKKHRINLNKVSRDVFIKKDRIEFVLKSEGEFKSFTTLLVRAQQNDRSMTFSIGLQKGFQTVSIFLTRERLQEMNTVKAVREFLTEVRIPVRKFTKETNFE